VDRRALPFAKRTGQQQRLVPVAIKPTCKQADVKRWSTDVHARDDSQDPDGFLARPLRRSSRSHRSRGRCTAVGSTLAVVAQAVVRGDQIGTYTLIDA
jgi:hypothetical protein